MDDIVFAGNRALYLILVMSAGPIAVATFVGLLVGLAIWREIIMRKYLLFFNERMVWRKIIFFWY